MAENKNEWTDQLRDLADRIANREKFTFDVNGEALMKQYNDQYKRQGQMAMMDTMGQAQAMTGGFGNSYAQSVGQQTYQNYMQGANDKIPELYQLALSKYQAEGSDLMDKYSVLADREAVAEEQRRYDQEWAAAHPTGRSSGGTTGTPVVDPTPVRDIAAEYAEVKQSGSSDVELTQLLEDAVQAGYISRREASDLRQGHR